MTYTIQPTANAQTATTLRRINNAEQRLENLQLKRERNGELTFKQSHKEAKMLARVDRLTGKLPRDGMTVIVDPDEGLWSYQVVDSPWDDTIGEGTYWIRHWGSSRCSQLSEADGNRNCSRRSGGGTTDRVDLDATGQTVTAIGRGMSGSFQQRMNWEDNGFYLESWSGGKLGEGERSAFFFTSTAISGHYEHPEALYSA